MDNTYKKARDEMSYLKDKLESLRDSTKPKTFEDRIARDYLEVVIDKIDTAIYKIDHYSKPSVEGTLRELENQKYELIDEKGKKITYFSCGDPIECFVEYDDEIQWCAGRVEHTTRDGHTGYYFYHAGAGHPFLHTGMKARVRRGI